MIHFKKIEYKNIQSVGNHPMKIDLDRSLTTLVGGHNGAGKSTLGNAIVYALYGKFLNGIKLAQGINTTNKKALQVTITFERNGEEWVVVRGEKPKKFEIYRDGELLDQYANARDQQTFLEIILGMDYKLFTQIVVLNKEKYVPFMELVAGDRRKIVEDLLDISIFTEMNNVVKDKITEFKRQESTLDRSLAIKTTELEGQQKLIKQIQDSLKQAQTQVDDQVTAKQNEINSLNDQAIEIQSEIDSIDISGQSKNTKLKQEYQNLALEFESQIKQSKQSSKFFTDNDTCPTCDQPIDQHLKEQKIDHFNSSIEQVQSTVSEMMDELTKVVEQDEEYTARTKRISDLNGEIRVINSSIKILQSDIKKLLVSCNPTTDDSALQDSMDQFDVIESDLESLKAETRDIIESREQYEALRVLLKDDGIKAVIIKEYNALMNQKINEYLQAMNFYVNMSIDENFVESFHAMHKENFSYENLSSGQKTRVNIAIFLALIDLASVKNSVVTNTIYMDELLEAVDAEGISDVMTLFKEKLYDKNIFVVSQRFDEFQDKFRSTLQFKLNEQEFTEIVR